MSLDLFDLAIRIAIVLFCAGGLAGLYEAMKSVHAPSVSADAAWGDGE